jgi:hypothetical protein
VIADADHILSSRRNGNRDMQRFSRDRQRRSMLRGRKIVYSRRTCLRWKTALKHCCVQADASTGERQDCSQNLIWHRGVILEAPLESRTGRDLVHRERRRLRSKCIPRLQTSSSEYSRAPERSNGVRLVFDEIRQ